MMDDLSDSEFDLNYEDELEVIREREALSVPKSPEITTESGSGQHNDDIETTSSISLVEGQNKRTIDDLFGDLDDFSGGSFESEFEVSDEIQQAKRAKLSAEATRQQMVNQILEVRRKYQESHQFSANNDNSYTNTKTLNEFKREKFIQNVSDTVPKWPFVRVTNTNGDYLFVRFHSKAFLEEEIHSISDQVDFNKFSDHSERLWLEADSILKQSASQKVSSNQHYDNQHLWTNTYKPNMYVELLSDEVINRALLKWIKLWDHVVFKKSIHQVQRNSDTSPQQSQPEYKPKYQKIVPLRLDATNRPEFKVALLCGPPGIGKTSMAHLIANNAGYNVVEVNASDERTVEAFRNVLENATQMQSLSGFNPKPNCIILDEIDGAPQVTVEFLIKFVADQKSVAASQKFTKKKRTSYLRRPIICICNDVYAPALRSLRQIAYQINFTEISKNRLSERLFEISQRERIKTDLITLSALCEKTNNDIRSCLTFLYFFKTKGDKKPLKLTDVLQSEICQKDFKSDLFVIWRTVFYLDRKQRTSLKERGAEVLKAIEHFNEFGKLTMGIFENYLRFIENRVVVSGNITRAVEAFSFHDYINTHIDSHQNYQLTPYLYRSFLLWHFVFATFNSRFRITYPTYFNEVYKKIQNTNSILDDFMAKHVPVSMRSLINRQNLILDLLPYLDKLIRPRNIRGLNTHLLTADERKELTRVLQLMHSFNLNYVQEKTNESFCFKLEPNIDDIVNFAESNEPFQHTLTYSKKQLISRELELMKVKTEPVVLRNQNVPKTPQQSTAKDSEDCKAMEIVPITKSIKTSVVRDFFGRIIQNPTNKKSAAQMTSSTPKNNLWYQFKEGYSNAVRKDVPFRSLL